MNSQTALDPAPQWDVRCLRSALRAILDTVEQAPDDLAGLALHEVARTAREALQAEDAA